MPAGIAPKPQPGGDREAGIDSIARLVAIDTDRVEPREFRLEKRPVTIGTARDNDLVVTDTTVSRHHARIRRRFRRYRVTDLGSTNGTFVNGRRLRRPFTLKRGDELRVGAVRFAFLARGGPGAAGRSRLSPGRRLATLAALALLLFAGGFAVARYAGSSDAMRRIASLLPGAWAPGASTPGAAASPALTAAPAETAGAAASAATAAAAGATPVAAETAAATAPGPASAAGTAADAGPGGGAAPQWLRRLNYYRTLAKLEPVVEDPALSRGDNKHTVYLVKNYAETIRNAGLGAEAHAEETGNPWYSPEGLAAAGNSDVDEWYTPGGELTPAPEDPDAWAADRAPGSEVWTIDGWIALPIHRLPILNPNLRSVGYGKYCEAGQCAAALDLGHVSTSRAASEPLSAPIEFPPAGSTLALREFGHEWPDPRTSCPGYTAPNGLPITLQLGNWLDARLGAYSIARVGADGKSSPLEACGFDAASYVNPDREAQSRVRDGLRGSGAVVVIPRAPLEKGTQYQVAMTVDDKQYNWTFSTSP